MNSMAAFVSYYLLSHNPTTGGTPLCLKLAASPGQLMDTKEAYTIRVCCSGPLQMSDIYTSRFVRSEDFRRKCQRH